jgi:hypothetical protein
MFDNYVLVYFCYRFEPTLKQQKLVSEDEVETVNTNQFTIKPKTTSFSTQTDMDESRLAGTQ